MRTRRCLIDIGAVYCSGRQSNHGNLQSKILEPLRNNAVCRTYEDRENHQLMWVVSNAMLYSAKTLRGRHGRAESTAEGELPGQNMLKQMPVIDTGRDRDNPKARTKGVAVHPSRSAYMSIAISSRDSHIRKGCGRTLRLLESNIRWTVEPKPNHNTGKSLADTVGAFDM